MKTTIKQSFLLLTAILTMAINACAHPNTAQEAVTPAQGDTIEVMSAAMQRNIKNVVIVPERYHDNATQQERFPVVYLLHGYDGRYDSWSIKTDLDALASRYDVIIVCPDGQDSWYVDSPVDETMQFETYVSHELVAYIDSHYRTLDNRCMRAITGLSMGGHGALFLAFRHPDVFWSCATMSGCMDITEFPERWRIKERLGDYHGNEQQWRDHAVCNQVGRLKDSALQPAPNILIDEGLNDIFIKNNVAMHELLIEQGIDHDFTLRPGRHTWSYWVNALDYHLLFFAKAFARGKQLMQESPDTDHQ